MQGDIVRVYNSEGVKLVSYVDTAWGDRASTTYHHGGANTTVTNNPFTYRGYYYDRDLGLYYLQSRYYDSKICRFINADHSSVLLATPLALTDKNLYAYCDNNPVMRVDNSGEIWNILIGAAVGAVVGLITGYVSQALDKEAPAAGTKEFREHLLVSAAVGAISGGLAASSVGLTGQVVVNSVLGAVGAAIDTAIDDTGNTPTETYLLRAAEGAAIGAIAGRIGNKGSASKHVSNHFWRLVSSPNHNFRYYFTQINVQAAKDGLKAIPSILKSTIPYITKTFLKFMSQEE